MQQLVPSFQYLPGIPIFSDNRTDRLWSLVKRQKRKQTRSGDESLHWRSQSVHFLAFLVWSGGRRKSCWVSLDGAVSPPEGVGAGSLVFLWRFVDACVCLLEIELNERLQSHLNTLPEADMGANFRKQAGILVCKLLTQHFDCSHVRHGSPDCQK